MYTYILHDNFKFKLHWIVMKRILYAYFIIYAHVLLYCDLRTCEPCNDSPADVTMRLLAFLSFLKLDILTKLANGENLSRTSNHRDNGALELIDNNVIDREYYDVRSTYYYIILWHDFRGYVAIHDYCTRT